MRDGRLLVVLCLSFLDVHILEIFTNVCHSFHLYPFGLSAAAIALMGTFRFVVLVLVGWMSLVVLAEDLLFPYMHGLNYSEYDQAIKLGLTGTYSKSPNPPSSNIV